MPPAIQLFVLEPDGGFRRHWESRHVSRGELLRIAEAPRANVWIEIPGDFQPSPLAKTDWPVRYPLIMASHIVATFGKAPFDWIFYREPGASGWDLSRGSRNTNVPTIRAGTADGCDFVAHQRLGKPSISITVERPDMQGWMDRLSDKRLRAPVTLLVRRGWIPTFTVSLPRTHAA